jgi:hypothetical protein
LSYEPNALGPFYLVGKAGVRASGRNSAVLPAARETRRDTHVLRYDLSDPPCSPTPA